MQSPNDLREDERIAAMPENEQPLVEDTDDPLPHDQAPDPVQRAGAARLRIQ